MKTILANSDTLMLIPVVRNEITKLIDEYNHDEILGSYYPREQRIDFEPTDEVLEDNCEPIYQGYCENVCQGSCNVTQKKEFMELLRSLSKESESEKMLVVLIKNRK